MTRPAAHRPWIASYGWIAFLGAGALITVLYLFVKPFAGSGPWSARREMHRTA